MITTREFSRITALTLAVCAILCDATHMTLSASAETNNITNNIFVPVPSNSQGLVYLMSGTNSLLSKRYVITLELKESHMTIDIWQHVEDEANKVTFNIPVDKEFYNSIKVGDFLKNEFRAGSFIVSGSLGGWEVKVVKKEEK